MTQTLRHSDIVMSWGGLHREACVKYGVTVWGWGPYYDSKMVAEARSLGLRVIASLVNLNIREPHTTEVGRDLFYNPALSATTCVDIAGEPIVVPWWAREYGEDNRAYWHCTNQPMYREHLRRVVHSGVLAGGNALHIDDAMANAMVVRLTKTGGCFCDACIRLFRDDLRERYTRVELGTLGIYDIDTFDYREMIRPLASTRAAYTSLHARGTLPLQDEFRLFQTRRSADFLGELVRCAKQTAGGDLPVSANLGTMRPDVLLGAVHPDYFVIELHFWRPTGDFPLQPLKLAQALGKPCATWPVGHDVERVRVQGASEVLLRWVVTTYALGHNFMMPYHMWCSTSATGMVFYDAPEDLFLPVYRFIRGHADLLDGFEEFPRFALLYSNREARSDSSAVERAGWEMFDGNLSYQLLLAGDEYCDRRLSDADAALYERVIVPDTLTLQTLDGPQRLVVEGWLTSGRAVYWEQARGQGLRDRVQILGGTKVWTVLRQQTQNNRTRRVLHLIDPEHDTAANASHKPRRVLLSIDRALFGSSVPAQVTMYSIHAPPSAWPVSLDGDEVRVEVAMTDPWHLLALNFERPS
jgi:hypothetical protein